MSDEEIVSLKSEIERLKARNEQVEKEASDYLDAITAKVGKSIVDAIETFEEAVFDYTYELVTNLDNNLAEQKQAKEQAKKNLLAAIANEGYAVKMIDSSVGQKLIKE